MKWIWRLTVITLLVVAVAMPWWMKVDTGQSVVKLPELPSLDSKKLEKWVPAPVGGSSGSSAQIFYKWQGPDGVWQYSDTPPEGNPPGLTQIEVRSDANLIPALDPDELLVDHRHSSGKEGSSDVLPRATQLLEDAKVARDAMETRKEHLDQQLESR